MNPEEKSQKQVPQQIDRLEELIINLGKHIDVLGEDLAPVLVSEEMLLKNPEGDEVKKQVLSPLANSIRGHCERIEGIYLQVSRLREQLQV